MPTPATTARLCLSSDAAHSLDDAVSVARRRSHSQTTSLHVVSALLSPPSTSAAQSSSSSSSSPSSSILRDALSRARSTAYSPRLQFKALELCFGVALDRLPSHGPSPPEEPPVSNSLMAAIKRSQANQRRNPDTFHFYQQQQHHQQSTIGFSGVKVELQQLILAILDDPVVSRVFGEAGFRSCDIKLAVLRPPPPPPSLLRFPRAASRCPPLFLCNLSPDGISSLPFTDGEENSRRVAEVLARKSGCRNPILVGAGAVEAANDFARAVEQQSAALIPPDIRGMKLISVENDVARGSWNEKTAEEIRRQAEKEPGVVVSVGDLKGLAEKENVDSTSEGGDGGVVAKITRLLKMNGGTVRVMGWSATYETYLKMLSKYPSLDRDWDLQLLPISYVKSGSSAGWLPRPRSFMESFIPFGGFFPTTHEPKHILNSPPNAASLCQQCDDRYEQLPSTSIGTQLQTNMPSWIHISETNIMKTAFDAGKAKDDRLLHGKVLDLKKNEKHLHHNIQILETDKSRMVPHTFEPRASSREESGDKSCMITDLNQSQENEIPLSIGLHIPSASQSASMPIIVEPEDENFTKLHVRPSKSEQLQRMGLCRTSISACLPEEVASPCSTTSVTTDLALGTSCETPRKVEKSSSPTHTEIFPLQNIDALKNARELKSYTCSDINSGEKGGRLAIASLKDQNNYSSSFGRLTQSSCTMSDQYDPRDYKALVRSLIEKVDWQEEAIRSISQAIARSNVEQEKHRGAKLWLHFRGPDKVGKRRIAQALAEFVYGSKENFICVDLSFKDLSNSPATICDQVMSKSDVTSRGKTSTDYIVGELSKKPSSVVLLENLDKADLLVQNSLSSAIRTGKFSDSHGRDFSINNNIFVTTSNMHHSSTLSSEKCGSYFPEERILRSQSRQMMISIEPTSNIVTNSNSPKVNIFITSKKKSASRQAFPCSNHLNKRKLDVTAYNTGQDETLGTLKRAHKLPDTFLDLNLPFEESVADGADSSTDENNFTSENPETWLEEFLELVDENVTFKPFDFDALADIVLKDIKRICQGTSGSSCTIEIQTECMDQILAATCLLEDRGALNKWLEHVLCRSFTDIQRRYKLSSNTALRLVTCEDVPLEEQDPQIALPSKIIVN